MAPVWRGSVDLGGVSGVTVLGVDARAAGRVMSPRADTLDDDWSAVTDRLVAARDLGGGLALPGAPASVTARVVTDSPLGQDGFAGSVRVRDARGLVTSVPRSRLHDVADPERRPARAGDGAAARRRRGVGAVARVRIFFFLPEPTFDLVVTGLAVDGVPVPVGNALRPSSDRLGLWLAAPAGPARPVPAVVTRESRRRSPGRRRPPGLPVPRGA